MIDIIKIMANDYKETDYAYLNFAVVVINMLKHGRMSGPSEPTTKYTSGVNIAIYSMKIIYIGNIFLCTEIIMVIWDSHGEFQS